MNRIRVGNAAQPERWRLARSRPSDGRSRRSPTDRADRPNDRAAWPGVVKHSFWMGCFWSDPYQEVGEVNPDDVFRYYGKSFYGAGRRHWSAQAASVDGMLDSFTWTHGPDIRFSRAVLEHHLPRGGTGLCADVGCGIGRISVHLLAAHFRRIDLVDPVAKFVAVAEAALSAAGVSVRAFVCGAQDWAIADRYDCFWVQWVLMFLTDDDCVALLARCRAHLSGAGIVVVKENVVLSADRGHALWSPRDHSLARTLPHLRELFARAALRVAFAQPQPDWSPEMLPVYCFVLRG
jgi:protein N-terminal methyltransferase